MLNELYSTRKKVKKMMNKEENPFKKSVLNGRQLALKVSMNSVYGFLAAQMLKCKPIAASVTTIGRQMIEASKNYAENDFKKFALETGLTDKLDVEVVYGDSVSEDTPLLIQTEHGNINIVNINELTNEWTKYGDKEQSINIPEIKIWSDAGWTKINKVIRHKTDKKMYRILTNTGCVDVTEDHSLLGINGEKIKPSECIIGTELLHSFPKKFEETMKLDKNKVWLYAYKKKISSRDILNADGESKKYFWNGIRYGNWYETENKKEAMCIYYILESIGLYPSITICTNNYYRISTNKKRDEINKIKRIILLKQTNSYVYDLETENHHFHAGVGQMVVHNTDSIFVKFSTSKTGLDAMRESFMLGKLCGEMITESLFKKPIDLEFEKVYNPLMLFGKKMYIGNLHEKSPEKADYIDKKGVALKRRDNCHLVKKVYQGAVDIIMEKGEHGIEEAITFVKNYLEKLTNGKVPMEDLITTKSLRHEYKTRTKPLEHVQDITNFFKTKGKEKVKEKSRYDGINIAHVKLAEKMKKRDPGSAPKSNDRIPYVFIEDPNNPINSKIDLSDRCENPDYVKKHNLNVDVLYYIKQQLQNPLLQFFGVLVDDANEIFDEAVNEYIKKKTKVQDIRTFFKPIKK